MPPVWRTSLGIGLEGGSDLVEFRHHRLGAYLRVDGELSDAGYTALTLGLAYRRY